MTKSYKFAAIGECMIEIRDLGTDGKAELAYGGDTLNTCVYLARLGRGRDLRADYLTALGDDPYSDAMLDGWRAEGIGCDHVRRLDGALPGLYLIRTDEKGERSFHYWRQQAAARRLWADDDWRDLAAALTDYDLIYLSGITLSIYDGEGRDRLAEALTAARAAGARVAFDSNYRPRGWADAAEARQVIGRFLALTDIALPTFDDERALFGDADVNACAARLADAGVSEIAIKLGENGCLCADARHRVFVPTTPVAEAVDTTAAGDSFNAAYLGSRLIGAPPMTAAQLGNRLAGQVVMHRGAVMPAAVMPDLLPDLVARDDKGWEMIDV